MSVPALREAAEYALAFMNDPEGLAAVREEWRDRLRAALAALSPSTPPALDVETLTEAIAEAMNHVPWPGERDSISFGGLTFAASARAIVAEYARLQEPDA